MLQTKDLIIRINLKDYRRAKRYLRPYPSESVAHYFNRLINKIEEQNDRIKNFERYDLDFNKNKYNRAF